ncbi:tRNA (adenosine(37)-N6)-threonylcarbamoyltransferase complex ATPase subunit type 1 TsaE [Roseiterribacter gracilis]|uniref:tRNA threonylcarbamoyladenosine biosynthesis protein TsaE n=1 Tax=Roseiterribacter gracilis TaxID=2812848 RepID=A0A8S8XD25_9PROT|nr:tRNA (adenosine(37)-N6)-threonylcarbamoyltransferase complex ATPase subunit type 1 TsaE [Rhodospirillales bacterium TMPK1]
MLALDLADLDATLRLAAALAPHLAAGDMVALDGTLGAGKTEFARALLRARLGDPAIDVPSPTFTLVQLYDDPTGTVFWHFDLYRLKDPDEVLELGWDDSEDGVRLVEWPDRLGDLTPQSRLVVRIEAGDGDGARRATLSGHGMWVQRLADLRLQLGPASLASS